MSNSWGHSLRLLKRGEEKYWFGEKCTAPKCQNKSEFVASYKYITGKAGRVSQAEKPLCREHAHKYAVKYHLTLPIA